MITREQARKAAIDYLNAAAQGESIEIVLLDEQTMERDWGWIFIYDSKQHLESGALEDMLFGGPLAVMRDDGAAYLLGVSDMVETQIERFEALHGLNA